MKNLILVLMFIIVSIAVKAQESNKSVVELKKWVVKDSKDLINKSKFNYTENKKTRTFYLQIEGKNLLLKEFETNKVIEKYALMRPGPGGPRKTCEDQKKAQELIFNTQFAPLWNAEANKTCKTIRYCYTYYCDGKPSMFVMYMFKPTKKECLYTDQMTKYEIKKYAFLDN